MDRRLKVVVVDDEEVILDTIRDLLQKENYDVITYLSAVEALQDIRKGDTDIVLTDLMMSEMDGLELMKAIREFQPEIPIIMITGYATIHTARHAKKLGAFDHVAKPFSMADLKDVVRRAADQVESSGTEVN